MQSSAGPGYLFSSHGAPGPGLLNMRQGTLDKLIWRLYGGLMLLIFLIRYHYTQLKGAIGQAYRTQAYIL